MHTICTMLYNNCVRMLILLNLHVFNSGERCEFDTIQIQAQIPWKEKCWHGEKGSTPSLNFIWNKWRSASCGGRGFRVQSLSHFFWSMPMTTCVSFFTRHLGLSIAFFAQSEPIWVCGVGTAKKIEFFYRWTPDFDGFGFFAAYWVCGKQKKYLKLGQNKKLVVVAFEPICMPTVSFSKNFKV